MKKIFFSLLGGIALLALSLGFAPQQSKFLSQNAYPGRVAFACTVVEGGQTYAGLSCQSAIGNSCKTLSPCRKIDAAGRSFFNGEQLDPANWPSVDFLNNEGFVQYMLELGWLHFGEGED